ncbi:MAG: prepilin-type N-terminal cleavage/methylation domain-containing protein [Planctomycetes bacterium]|nr:prepilin-type N-terminal cleavage/methylation domain-containing protein [Planctomycetota bacterium]
MIHAIRRGFTLLEVTVATGLLSMIMLVVAQSLDVGSRLSERVTRQTDLDNRANDVLNTIALELRTASAKQRVQIVNGNPVINFDALEVPRTDSTSQSVYAYAVSNGIVALAADAGYTDSNGNGAYDVGEPFADTNGNGTYDPGPTYNTGYESTSRTLTYDKNAGTLTKAWIASGGLLQSKVLCDHIKLPPFPVDGSGNPIPSFSITRVGTTLQMRLVMEDFTRVGDDLLYTAQSQVLFLRSTLNSNLGSCPISGIPDPGGDISATLSAGPSINYGNLITLFRDPNDPTQTYQQVILVVAAPIGLAVNRNSIQVVVKTDTSTQVQTIINSYTLVEGAAVATPYPSTSIPSGSLTQTTMVSSNGNYTIRLEGTVTGPIQVQVTAATTTGAQSLDSKSY